ncbi:MAG: ABC transporter permease [Blautia sp.]|nr:ABC transporter permease [Blautia sp.]
MQRFLKDLKRFWAYTVYSAKSDLKDEVASSYLNWLWWILDPLLFMCVYTFIALAVFHQGVPYFPVFVFIGLTLWNFFDKSVLQSVKAVRNNGSVVSRVYFPKYILVINRILVNGFKMMVSFVLIVVLMLIYRVPVSLNVFYVIPILMELTLFTFGVSCIVLHFGVFIDDLYNVIQVVLKLLFYLSGVFYDISRRVEEPLNSILLDLNPVSMLMQSARQCLLYQNHPDLKLMGIHTAISFLLCIIGIKVIYQYENSYVKVM